MSFYTVAKRLVVAPTVNAVFRPWVKGSDNIPTEGPAIVVSNHMSFSDSIFIPVALPRQVHFLAKSDYWQGRGVTGALQKWFFTQAGQIPMDRSGGAASQNALTTAEKALKEGHVLGIYPEGTRSPDGRLYRGKIGVARLALKAQVPVIPMALINTNKVQPVGKTIPRIHRVGLIIGKPMTFESHYDDVDNRRTQRAVTDEIMTSIKRLSGQEYVDRYADVVKRELAAEAETALGDK